MNCARVDRLAERFVDGRLPARLAARVTVHLARCEHCRVRVEVVRSVTDALRSVEGVRAPQGFSRRVMVRVYREEDATARRGVQLRRTYRGLGFSFLATAAILSASLSIPRLAYPDLIRPQALAAQLVTGRPEVVARVIDDAGVGFRDLILSGAPEPAVP